MVPQPSNRTPIGQQLAAHNQQIKCIHIFDLLVKSFESTYNSYNVENHGLVVKHESMRHLYCRIPQSST